ncbi:Bug family tripartite tricarboxylate transporter substrate binding protein [Comamonas fluminis]|uniref:Bug family tripartite tricarboxylate transporter substrate binding protein n=1 Tax=Comamonas fluminis TaxID=2796366 RepID=UPI001C45A473|nr:tripartite tricarboxylate transporter substrate binding protein [Comamonas fluminis]
MPTPRRTFVAAAALLAAGFSATAAMASGNAWPAAKPITLIVPFSAGGNVDTTARLIGQKLGERLHQSVVIDNVPGAGGVLGVSKAVKAPADGYTLLMGFDGPISIAQLVNSAVKYDAEKDLIPVGLTTIAPVVAVARPGLPAHNLNELIALARSKPGSLTYATSGVGTMLHLAMEMLQERAKIKLVHVPYRGGAQITSDVMGGQVDIGMLTTVSAVPMVQQKKLEGLGVTSARRIDAIPNVPTFGETAELKGFDLNTWTGLFVPAKTPQAVVIRLATELDAVLKLPEVKKRLEDGGATPGSGTQASFVQFLKKEKAGYAQIVKSAHIQAE